MGRFVLVDDVDVRLRRSVRDWLTDAALFAVAVLYAAGWWLIRLGEGRDAETITTVFLVAVAASCLLWLRRRMPVVVAAVLIPVTMLDDLTAGAMLVALLTVAIRRPLRTTAIVCAARALTVAVYLPLVAGVQAEVLWVVAFNVVSSVGVVGWGLFVRHRRALVRSLRERAEHAETEARLRAEHAQHAAREEIAREMHDVLGHRLSLLSVHAGALEYRPDAPPVDIARTAGVIRDSAHQALQDLREVIGVLRASEGELPQPAYADLSGLVAESERAGMAVELVDEVVGGEPPPGVGRTAYRIVQEALTNARRHAPGAAVTVRLSGGVGDGLTVEVRNGAATSPPETAGSGRGLAGLSERAKLAGGRLDHAPTTNGGFCLTAWLPWRP